MYHKPDNRSSGLLDSIARAQKQQRGHKAPREVRPGDGHDVKVPQRGEDHRDGQFSGERDGLWTANQGQRRSEET